jgi:phosphatidylinositol-3-phosphatase
MKKILKLSLLSLGFLMISQNHTNAQSNIVPKFSHIVVVIGENTSASNVFGNANAPYINALAAQGAKFTSSFGVFHPSQPNYLALYSGGNQGITNDNLITTKFSTANLGRELIDAGKTFVTYSEDLPSVGFDGKTNLKYARKHNPAANWMGTGTNKVPVTTNQPFTAFPTNFNNLPSVSFVVPNLCNDGHDSCAPLNNGTKQYDTWIKNNLDAYKKWCILNNSLLIVTYDEDDFTTVNKIATVIYGAKVALGANSQTINHYSVLRTIEDAFNIPTHAGAANTASAISCWTTVVAKLSGEVINKTEDNTKFELSPNPSNGSEIKIKGIEDQVVYEISNSFGQKIENGILKNETISIDSLPKGVYYIQFFINTKILKKTFIKN